ncbi:DUF805 domain-containing protein [Porphyromonas crevioricanis]|uniref:DUF805 domain-containing protein n=1 Tax=Porphyromonas crevioricanis TaxID=393921 RepID=UPI00068BA0DD|nr:DUF805 domain-containing protein [Porphyromonas crevioricanis]
MKKENSLFDYWLGCWMQYANFRGRAGRKEFWSFMLFQFLIFFVLDFVRIVNGTGFALFSVLFGSILGGSIPSGMNLVVEVLFALFSLLFFLFSLVPTMAVLARRLHDTGRSGWWGPLFFLSIVSNVTFFAILINSWGRKGGIPFFLLSFVNLLLAALLFAWTISRGDLAENKYGPSTRRLIFSLDEETEEDKSDV